MINEQAAAKVFGGDAVGRAFIDGAGRRLTVAGVVRTPPLRASTGEVAPAMFVPAPPGFQRRMIMIIAGPPDAAELRARVAQALDGIPGGMQPPKVVTFDDALLRTSLASDRIAALLMRACTVAGLLLGAIGMAGAIAESVRSRQRDYALRRALGAGNVRVMLHVFAGAVRLAVGAAAIGAPAAWFAIRWLAPGLPDAHAASLVIGPIALAMAAVLSSVLPARRALASDPLTLLRDA